MLAQQALDHGWQTEPLIGISIARRGQAMHQHAAQRRMAVHDSRQISEFVFVTTERRVVAVDPPYRQIQPRHGLAIADHTPCRSAPWRSRSGTGRYR